MRLTAERLRFGTVCATSALVIGASGPPGGGATHGAVIAGLVQAQRIRQSWTSSSGQLEAHADYGPDERPRQLKLRSLDWIAVNDSRASDEMVIRLFRRSEGLAFTEAEPSPTGVSWSFFLAQEGVGEAMFHHRYARAIAFSTDSQALLLKLSGLATPRGYLDDWFCVYDIAAGKASLSLVAMNRGARQQR
jgi:hypothetical protein